MTTSQSWAGTLPYTAPEQFQGQAVFASDQYALAIMAYEWLCGERPFEGSETTLAYQHAHVPPPRLREKDPSLPEAVEAVVLKALSKQPEQRYISILTFARALERACRGEKNSPISVDGETEVADEPHTTSFWRVFLSHAPSDDITLLNADLTLRELAVQREEASSSQSTDTSSQEERMRQAIRAAQVVLLVLTPHARSATAVHDHLRIARLYRRRILCLWQEGETLQDLLPAGAGAATILDARGSRYKEALDEIIQAIEREQRGVTNVAPVLPELTFEPRNPYKGLHAFTQADRADFFGRHLLVQELLAQLKEQLVSSGSEEERVARFLAVVGPSGSGKSSVVMAGLLPALQDGRLVLIGYWDGTIRLWEVGSGRQLRQMEGHTDWVVSAAFSPDGRLVLTGSKDKTARIWEISSGQQLRQMEGHTGEVWSVAFSPNGQLALTGSLDKTARLWEISSGQQLRLLQGHTGVIGDVAFSPNGQLMLTGSWDYTARLWEVESGQLLRQLKGHWGAVSRVAFSSDGRFVLTSSPDKTARMWDVESGNEIRRFGHTHEVTSVAFSPDGKLVLTGSSDYTVRLWEVSGEREYTWEKDLTSEIGCVAFSPDGRLALTGSRDGTIRLWAVESGRQLWLQEGIGSWIESVASVAEAEQRLRLLDEEGLIWFEEPTRADDYAGHAHLRQEARTLIQLGENWWGLSDMTKSLAAGASDLVMTDVMKIGGVTGWLRGSALAASAGLPLSSHIFPEISVHLLAVSPTAHWLEYLDLAASVLEEPVRADKGQITPSSEPGAGIRWREEMVQRFLLT